MKIEVYTHCPMCQHATSVHEFVPDEEQQPGVIHGVIECSICGPECSHGYYLVEVPPRLRSYGSVN